MNIVISQRAHGHAPVRVFQTDQAANQQIITIIWVSFTVDVFTVTTSPKLLT